MRLRRRPTRRCATWSRALSGAARSVGAAASSLSNGILPTRAPGGWKRSTCRSWPATGRNGSVDGHQGEALRRHRRRRADRLAHGRCAARTRTSARSSSTTTSCAAPRENLADALRDDRGQDLRGRRRHPPDRHPRRGARGADGVFHFAALWLLQCHEYPARGVRRERPRHVQRARGVRRDGVERLVYSSSASVYGDAVEEPMTEDHPFNNTNFYGATKIAGEAMAARAPPPLRPAVRRPALHERLRPAPGLPGRLHRRDHEDARRDRPRRAAVVLRRRHQAYDFVYVGDCARGQRLRHEGRHRRPLLQRRHRACAPRCAELARAAARDHRLRRRHPVRAGGH